MATLTQPIKSTTDYGTCALIVDGEFAKIKTNYSTLNPEAVKTAAAKTTGAAKSVFRNAFETTRDAVLRKDKYQPIPG